MLRKIMIGLSVFTLALTTFMGAVIAQDATPVATLTPIPVEGALVLYTGALNITPEGDIFVGIYKVAPAGAFIPSLLQTGQTVTVVGRLLPDNVTIQAYSLEVEVDEEPTPVPTVEPTAEVTLEPTVEATLEPTLEPTAEVTLEPTVEATLEPTPEATEAPEEAGNTGFYCRNIDTARHPVGERIANEFSVDYAEVMNAFCVDRLGFGQITRAYALEEDTGVDADTIIASKAKGKKWTEIIVENGIDVTDVSTDRVFGQQPWSTSEIERGSGNAQGSDKGKKDNNGNGNNGNSGNGNSGNGGNNGNGNGGGNGNNGNGGGNGKGNGNGGGNGNNGNGGGNGGGGGKGGGKK